MTHRGRFIGPQTEACKAAYTATDTLEHDPSDSNTYRLQSTVTLLPFLHEAIAAVRLPVQLVWQVT